MNFKDIRCAVAVARYGSITAAAEELYMAQPNLSRCIANLERDLGFTLFTRSKKGITPTPLGEYFLSEAEKSISHLEEAARHCRCASGRNFHFSVVPSSLYMNIILDHARICQPYELKCKEAKCPELFSNLDKDISDAAFVILAVSMKGDFLHYLEKRNLVYFSITQSPLYLIISRKSSHYREEADGPSVNMENMDMIMNTSYFEPIGLKFTNPPYKIPAGQKIYRGLGRAGNLDFLDVTDNLLMLSCYIHPRVLKRNHLASIPYHPDIPIYEYGYIVKKEKARNRELMRILDEIAAEIKKKVPGIFS